MPAGMTITSLCNAARLMGMSPAALADALTPAPQGECGWLDGTCHEPTEGDWLCATHNHGPSMVSSSSPRMPKAVK